VCAQPQCVSQDTNSKDCAPLNRAESAAPAAADLVLEHFQLRSQQEVTNMKLNCFNSAGKDFTTITISGLLICALLAVGCSKEKTTPASSETQTSSNQTLLNQPTLNQPATPGLVASAASTIPTPAQKKIVKKRPSTVTYKDQTDGVSFRYPRIYSLKSTDDSNSASVPTDFVQLGGVTAVLVEMPKGLYPNTDLASAFFRVTVDKGISEAECGQFALPQLTSTDKDKGVVQPSKMAMGALDLQEVEDISGEETKQADTKYYHLFQNSACYEFALSLSTDSAGDDETVKPVDREKVFRRLETILATVQIKPEVANPVAAGTVATPTAQADAAPASTAPTEVSK
jgi:hypothetical protein